MKVFYFFFGDVPKSLKSIKSFEKFLDAEDEVSIADYSADELEGLFVRSLVSSKGWGLIQEVPAKVFASLKDDDLVFITSSVAQLPEKWRETLLSIYEEKRLEGEECILTCGSSDAKGVEVPAPSMAATLVEGRHLNWYQREYKDLGAVLADIALDVRLRGVRTIAVPLEVKVISKEPVQVPERTRMIDDWAEQVADARVCLASNGTVDERTREMFDGVVTPKDLSLPSGVSPETLWEALYSSAASQGYDWVFFLQKGERLCSTFNKESLRKLVGTPLKTVRAYVFKVVCFWDENNIRLDGEYGRLYQPRLVRVVPKLEFSEADEICNFSSPEIPKGLRFFTPYIIESHKPAKRSERAIVVRYSCPTVGLVVIAKDEEEYLDVLLESYYTYFNEIVVVVDTRTTDRTREVAERYGARVVEFDWVDDFAAMRNAGVDACTCDYICQLDPDERVEKLSQIYNLMLMGWDACLFPVANHHPTGAVTYSDSYRLFKNDGLRYSGRCHETIEESLSKDRRTRVAPVMIHHFGYMKGPEKVDKKLELYNKLNKLRVKDDPQDPRPYFDIALERINDGEVDEAIELLEKSKKLGPSLYLPRKELGLVYLRLGYKNLEEALERIPDAHPMRKSFEDYTRRVQAIVEPEVFVGSKAKRLGGDRVAGGS